MSIFEKLEIKEGKSSPLGISRICISISTKNRGINFAFYSENKDVFLVLKNGKTTKEIELNRNDNIHHIEIENLPKDTLYAYKVENEIKQDPYARSFASPNSWGAKTDEDTYLFAKVDFENKEELKNLEKIQKPNIKFDDLIIYEMHVRAFTKDISTKTKNSGKFLGIIEKIDYLKKLGVNAIELMPIYEFDENSYSAVDPDTKKRLFNFWGYSPVSFFSIMKRYGSEKDFKNLVENLHKNGLEIILDVVYNHMQNPIKDKNYFLLDENKNHLNFSGCGNTCNANSKVGAKLIVDSLIYFVENFNVDGFRFDLASILTRGKDGITLEKPLILEMIKNEKKLKDIKLIAEPWDAANLNQLGFFTKYNFYEWNDKYRDVVRKFIKGDENLEKDFVDAILGKKDVNSINFVTCHDGFTLNDLVSFEKKHNEKNLEKNRDGNDFNFSKNYGIEGFSDDEKINEIRLRQAKNFMLALMISKDVPMIYMGDEYLHTKNGNNNTWCQDNKLNYFLWNNEIKFFDFIKFLIEFRNKHKSFLSYKKAKFEIKKNFIKILSNDFIVIFNTSENDINVEISDGKYKVLLDTFDGSERTYQNKITLKNLSAAVLQKTN
ncbi:MAG: hypothetical protein KR126chlam6_00044 [Candidatus Anoxychlamydiales bacterium]|nr:hypothetical protein [Candidatus Anoxychlamydiales bacterium]